MAEEKLAAIFQAALELFSTHGFEKATIDEIAAKAKVAKGTIFYHCKSKEELFNQMIRRGVERIMQTLHDELAGVPDPLEKLKSVIRIQTSMLYGHPEMFRILLSEIWGTQDRQKAIRETLGDYFRLLESVAADGICQGRIRGISPATVADMVFGMTSTAAIHLLLLRGEQQGPSAGAAGEQSLEQVITDLQGMLVAGVATAYK